MLGAIYPNNHVTIDSSDIITKCLKIVGMHNYHPEHLKTSIELVLKSKDRYPYKKLVGPSFDFSAKGLEDAFKSLDSKQSLRPAINPNWLMEGVILAAGKGTRMGKIDSPKCLLEINEVPIIKYQIESFRKNGIKDVHVVTGYESEMIHDLLHDDCLLYTSDAADE